jgi:hypothetical protein
VSRRGLHLTARTGIIATIVLAIVGFAVATLIYYLEVEARSVWCVVTALITLLLMRVVFLLSDGT